MSARERAARVVFDVVTAFTWALLAVCVVALFASCSTVKAELPPPGPDGYGVILPATSTTLAAPGYTPVPAGLHSEGR